MRKMSVVYKTNAYGTPKNILARPDGYVAYGFKHVKATAAVPGNAVLVDGRYIVKAGTIYPANDVTAIGVVLNDYDVTDGDAVMAVVTRGDILTAAIPKVPVAAAISALKDIAFLPHAGVITPTWNADITDLEYAAAAAAAGTKTIAIKFAEPVRFRPEATILTNWTFTGETTVKITVESIAISDDGLTATLTLKTTATALVAGTITALPEVAAVSIGVVPAAAVTIATVA